MAIISAEMTGSAQMRFERLADNLWLNASRMTVR
jgi:hypothetical protein